MTVLNIILTVVKDEEKLKEYIARAGPILKASGAEVLLRGQYTASLFGEAKSPHVAALFRFADMETAKAAYQSAAYMALIPLRDAGGDITFDFYEEA